MPDMKTDITLQKDGKTLIIDAKYYGHILKSSHQNAQKKLPSANLYQIFAYVKNLDRNVTGNISGLLLYAKTNEPTISIIHSKIRNSFCNMSLNFCINHHTSSF